MPGIVAMVTYMTGVHKSEHVEDVLASHRLIAVTVLEDSRAAAPLAAALNAGGLRCVEVTLRTASALDTIATMSGEAALVVGAGTVLDADQATRALDAGARFVVSPGFDRAVVGVCQERGVPVFPGVATATDIMAARAAGLDTVKFFPAGQLGGVPMLKALAGPFRTMRFIPTGGVDASNVSQYLALPSVVAVGGTWMVPPALLDARDWAGVERLTRQAVDIIRERAQA
jgi:2-dehydro-3-deoxyphosphogluconate aldolase / (4S)-4-hydroxy-2-oxoglutarate aldolase